jgi:hypothetical protein
MVNRYPYGYQRPPGGGPQGMGTMLTWAEMMTKITLQNTHPEVRRRFKALIEAAAKEGVPLGIGTAWRVQPDPPPPGFAKPGNSWHESCPTKPTSATALAIDTVPDVSWPWMEKNCGRFGFRTFKYVNNEPWHIQPSEIPAARSYATKLPPLKTWPLPSDQQPLPPFPSGDDVAIRIFGSMPDPNKPQFAEQFTQEFYALFYAVCDNQGRSIQMQWSGSGDDPACAERLRIMQANFGDGPGLYGSWPVSLAGVKNNTLDPKDRPEDIIDTKKAGGWSDKDFAP